MESFLQREMKSLYILTGLLKGIFKYNIVQYEITGGINCGQKEEC